MLSGIKFVPRDKLLEKESSSESDIERSQKRKQKNKKKKRSKRDYTESDSDSSSSDNKRGRRKRKHRKGKGKRPKDDDDDEEEDKIQERSDAARKEMGLEWMTGAGKRKESFAELKTQDEEENADESLGSKTNPRELNPYLKDNGMGYPDDASHPVASDQPLPSSLVGDGGVSWRLKALKRAKEQAAREGRELDAVVEERWGSLGQLAASVAARRSAPSHAHLRAIRERKGFSEKPEATASGEVVKGEIKEVNRGGRDYLRDVSSRHPEMKRPKDGNISWKRNKGQHLSAEDTSLVSAAVRGLNKFADDGSFMDKILPRKSVDDGDSNWSPPVTVETNDRKEIESVASAIQKSSAPTDCKPALTANQLAAKALQLRMKGKHEEAEKLLRDMEAMKEKHDSGTTRARPETVEDISRFIGRQATSERKKREDDADFNLAQNIMQNKKYSLSGRADDEYDFDGTPSKSRHRRKEGMPDDKRNAPSRFLTQQERCQFCFENQSRPKHLVVSIANFTYMMLPQWQPVVPGHCCILPMQHDCSTRTVDKNVWEELRNFKKCLLRMFAQEDKDVVFLETVVEMGKQRRHCLIDCIPIPSLLSKQAPLYFKKAIDEAEEEWGQHEMKKVLPTSGNLRNVIPENMSYFHVEFGLDRGFAHVIDDDSNFMGNFGLNVIRGMLRLPEEDMHRRRRQESTEKQKVAVASFLKDWAPFDWTTQLD